MNENSEIGELINRMLAERQLTRQAFCDMYEIPIFRLNRMARGEKIHHVDYKRIIRLLQLGDGKSTFLVFGENVQNSVQKSKISRTPLGWEIKRKLAFLDMTQKEFCEKHGIPTGRMAKIVTGKRLAKRHRRQIIDLLGIDENEFPLDDENKNNHLMVIKKEELEQ